MALQKVKGNLERMFDKNLNDLVRYMFNILHPSLLSCVCYRQGNPEQQGPRRQIHRSLS